MYMSVVALMTDARFPERWLNDRRIQRSGAHFQSFANALLWSVANRTDGVIEPEDLPLIPGFTTGMETEFAASGVWIVAGRSWLIAEFDATQTSRDELEALEQTRASSRKRKARERAAKAAAQDDVAGLSRDMSRGQSRDKSAMSRDLHRQAGRQAGKASLNATNNQSKEKNKTQGEEESNRAEKEEQSSDARQHHQDVDPADYETAIRRNVDQMYES
jgi:hypothetical protein